MPKNPLAEVFGYPAANMSQDAVNHRNGRLCPYNNPSGPNCTKNSATDPLGVCTIFDGDDLAVTCPVRTRKRISPQFPRSRRIAKSGGQRLDLAIQPEQNAELFPYEF